MCSLENEHSLHAMIGAQLKKREVLIYSELVSTQDNNHEQRSKGMIKVYRQSFAPFKNKVYEKIERNSVLSKEEYDRRRAVGI